MSPAFLSLLLLGLATVPFAVLWIIRKSQHDGWLYLLASLSILFLTASLLVWAPAAYDALGGTSFMPKPVGEGAFDTQSYSGFLQILFGVPVAVAGSLYAILLARQSERQSNQFNAYEIGKNFRDRLEQRNLILGRFAIALRNINNTAFILLAQVERALSVLPETGESGDGAVARIQREADKMDGGLAMLRTALEDYRDATIAVQAANIKLDTGWRAPFDTIGWQFYGRDPAPAESEAGAGAPPQRPATEFIDAFLARDYQAAADRFVVRAYQLSAQDMVRARLERMVQTVLRWSEDAQLRRQFKGVRAIVMGGGLATADINGDSDYVGFRFIGPALIRADNAVAKGDPWKLPMRVDVGSAILLDSFLALPGKAQSEREIRTWDEWTFLGKVVGDAERAHMLAAIAEPGQYFPKNFTDEVALIQSHYGYSAETDPAAQQRQVAQARLSYCALFHHMPPPWMEGAFDDLAAQVTGAAPPTKELLIDRVVCLAVGIQMSRLNGARAAAMHAVDAIVQSMAGAVERQLLQLGSEGLHNWRRCLLIGWALHPEAATRQAICAQLQAQLAQTTESVLVVQLHLDLFDCHTALGRADLAAAHVDAARTYLEGLSPAALGAIRWFAPSYLEDPATWLDPQIVLFGLWLSGYLMKQPGDLHFAGQPITETEVAMPQGFLPRIWLGLVRTGLITLATPAAARLCATSEANFGDGLIDPDQGRWEWAPAAVSRELDRLAGEPGAADSYIDYLYEHFGELEARQIRTA